MTTAAWSSRIRHDSDANFREWGSELSGKLATVGLVQTADTGQINWTTVTRPGSNTNAGYEIWRFDDALQATAPVYIRLDYGTGSTTTAPRIQLTVGDGSNGSGTITSTNGTTWTANQIANYNTGATTDTVYPSYLCYKDGFLGLDHKDGSGNSNGSFFIGRFADSDGTENGDGIFIFAALSSSNTSWNLTGGIRFAATAQTFTRASTSPIALAPIPQISSIDDSGNLQAYLAYYITPTVRAMAVMCAVWNTEVPVGNTFLATLLGATQRTYIGLGSTFAFSVANGGTSTIKLAMLWE